MYKKVCTVQKDHKPPVCMSIISDHRKGVQQRGNKIHYHHGKKQPVFLASGHTSYEH